MKITSLAAGASLMAVGLTLQAAERRESPDAQWSTIHTAHYRIHHPQQPEIKAFARYAADRIEGIHALLERQVGHALPGPTDVLVQNPIALTNGMVLPFLNRPMVVLLTEPLDSDWEISHQGDWIEGLLLHELVHLHHLTIPDRRPKLVEKLQVPRLSRVAQRSPSWVVEGYATFLEGRLTGGGRPHGPYRAMVLRLRALSGRVPSYEAMTKGERDTPTQSGTQYLFGSAFMEWLLKDRPDATQPWQDLWKRLSSRRYPTFDAAFQATFGDQAKVLYQRFTAELTHDALDLERRILASGLQEGTLWHQVEQGFLRDLSVSPDGTRLLALQAAGKDSGIAIWNLNAPLADAKAQEKARAKDPDLPQEAARQRPVRGREHLLYPEGILGVVRPRWESDGSVRFRRWKATAEGTLQHTEGTWHPAGIPAAPVQARQLYPTLQGRTWGVTFDGRRFELPFEPFGPLAWDVPRKLLYAATEVDGVFNLVRLSFDPTATQPFGPREVLTRTVGGAAYPFPTPDGKSLFFGLITGQGSQIRRLDLGQPPLPPLNLAAANHTFVPGSVRSVPDQPSLVPSPTPAPEGRPYDPQETHTLAFRSGYVFSPSGESIFLGMGGNDLLGRLNWVALGAVGAPGQQGLGPRGGMVGAAWRGWRFSPSLQVFSRLERPSVQRFEPIQGFDQERRGAELGLTREWMGWPFVGRVGVEAATERIHPTLGTATFSRSIGGLRGYQRFGLDHGRFTLSGSAEVLAQRGQSDGKAWNRQRGALWMEASYRGWDLAIRGEQGRCSGDPTLRDRFTLGGQSDGLLPRSLEGQQVFQPALPAFSAQGNRFQRWRVEGMGFYLEGTALWNEGTTRPNDTRVCGAELQGSFENLPVLRDFLQRILGRPEFRIGLHRPLDGPMKSRTVFTLALTQRF